MRSMSTLLSSAPNSEIATIRPSSQAGVQRLDSGTSVNSNWSSTALELPKLTTQVVATAKAAGRIAATHISEVEHDRLLAERQRLLDKKFGKTISKAEENRLAYVRWSLDRIEDAKYGASLDLLEAQVASYEALQTELAKFYSQLNAKVPHRNR